MVAVVAAARDPKRLARRRPLAMGRPPVVMVLHDGSGPRRFEQRHGRGLVERGAAGLWEERVPAVRVVAATKDALRPDPVHRLLRRCNCRVIARGPGPYRLRDGGPVATERPDDQRDVAAAVEQRSERLEERGQELVVAAVVRIEDGVETRREREPRAEVVSHGSKALPHGGRERRGVLLEGGNRHRGPRAVARRRPRRPERGVRFGVRGGAERDAVSPFQIFQRRGTDVVAAVLAACERRLGDHFIEDGVEIVAARGIRHHNRLVDVEVQHEARQRGLAALRRRWRAGAHRRVSCARP
mmetsp:Transcript_18190/g.56816  ORF Transcript_18190/g.56816 Transcript_18190/m.56816 type:complete len:299 (-) Transcript_18190:887-1783(-)